MRFRLHRLEYLIACHPENRAVSGYALQLSEPFTELRFCVRRHASGDWGIDHYDSGMMFAGPLIDVLDESKRNLRYFLHWQFSGRTMEDAILWLHRYLHHLKRSGKLASLPL